MTKENFLLTVPIHFHQKGNEKIEKYQSRNVAWFDSKFTMLKLWEIYANSAENLYFDLGSERVLLLNIKLYVVEVGRLASVIYDIVFETKQLLKKFCIVEAGWLLIIFLTHSHERPRLVGTDASWTGGPGFRLKMKSNCQRKQQKRNLSNTNKRGSVILDLSSGKYLRKQNLATVGLNKMLRFPVCITAICALFLTKLQQRILSV